MKVGSMLDMHIDNLPQTTCFVCGSKVIKYTVDNPGTGYRTETAQYMCGLGIGFNPHFGTYYIESVCRNDSEYIISMEKRKAFIDQLNRLVRDADVDEQFRGLIYEKLEYGFLRQYITSIE